MCVCVNFYTILLPLAVLLKVLWAISWKSSKSLLFFYFPGRFHETTSLTKEIFKSSSTVPSISKQTQTHVSRGYFKTHYKRIIVNLTGVVRIKRIQHDSISPILTDGTLTKRCPLPPTPLPAPPLPLNSKSSKVKNHFFKIIL